MSTIESLKNFAIRVASTTVKSVQLAPKSKKYDQKTYVQLQHREGAKEFLRERVKIVASISAFLKFASQKDILHSNAAQDNFANSFFDVGSRDGYAVELMQTLGFKASGIELLPDYVAFARKKGRNLRVGDVHKLVDKTNSYDLVFCRHVLEHTMDPKKAISEMVRVAKPNGLVVISFPLELNPFGKHTSAIPNLRVLAKLAKAAAPNATIVYCGRSAKLGIPEVGQEACCIIQK